MQKIAKGKIGMKEKEKENKKMAQKKVNIDVAIDVMKENYEEISIILESGEQDGCEVIDYILNILENYQKKVSMITKRT